VKSSVHDGVCRHESGGTDWPCADVDTGLPKLIATKKVMR
jgi:hypothetical protein